MQKVVSNWISRLFLGVVLLSLVGCNESVVYQEVKHLSEEGWSKDSTVTFECEMKDTTGMYEVVIDVRHSGDYMYQNLWLFIEAVSPKGDIYGDTIECVLSDNYGRPVGDAAGGLFSDEYQLPMSFMRAVKFPKDGKYRFEISQGMREDVLRGITDIGVRIRETEYENE